MDHIAIAIAVSGFLIALTINLGFKHMSKTLEQATEALTEAVSAIVADVASALDGIAAAVSEHIANGTATTAIQAQADRLKALDEQLKAAEAPADNTAASVVDGPADADFTNLKKASKSS